MSSYSSTIIGQNPTQMSLKEAIDLVADVADEKWLATALSIVRQLCETRSEFSTDDVWERLSDVATKEPRAMGAIMRMASKRGWCTASGRYVQSSRPECHRRPVSVWKSLVQIPLN